MKLLTPLVALWAFIIVGCASLNGGNYSFSMIFVNIGAEDINALNIKSLDTGWDFWGPYSVLIPFAPKSHSGPIGAPPNGRYIYSWKDVKGIEHREEIDLGERVSRLFQGEIVFIVDGGNKLTVETYNKRGAYRLPRKPKQ